MLTDPYIQQLVHIKKRVRKKEVLDMSSTFTKRYPRNVMEKIKAHSPDTMLPKDIKMWFEEHDIQLKLWEIKQDITKFPDLFFRNAGIKIEKSKKS